MYENFNCLIQIKLIDRFLFTSKHKELDNDVIVLHLTCTCT